MQKCVPTVDRRSKSKKSDWSIGILGKTNWKCTEKYSYHIFPNLTIWGPFALWCEKWAKFSAPCSELAVTTAYRSFGASKWKVKIEWINMNDRKWREIFARNVCPSVKLRKAGMCDHGAFVCEKRYYSFAFLNWWNSNTPLRVRRLLLGWMAGRNWGVCIYHPVGKALNCSTRFIEQAAFVQKVLFCRWGTPVNYIHL